MNTIKNKKILIDISGNTIQVIATQFFGLLIFYFTSKYLSKEEFGEYNWSIALGFTIISIASLGLDLVYVKRIASGYDRVQTIGIHFFHSIVVSLLFLAIVFLSLKLFPEFKSNHPFFLIVFLNICLINIANSFKLGLNGLDSYLKLAIIAVLTNLLKFIFLIFLYITNHFYIYEIIYFFIISSVVEMILGYLFLSKLINIKIKPLYRLKEYKSFILESLPQLGVVIFDSALSRIDVILLGILTTSIITAEYSFVYKVYELSKLPILIIGPILLTRFSKIFNGKNEILESKKNAIDFLFKIELAIVMIIPIILISIWTPVVDYFTNNKYGEINEVSYWILSACVPLVCIVNFLWTLGFVQGQLKKIMYITLVVSIINIFLNLLLIHLYGGIGSAISFLISTLLQVLLYYKLINQTQIQLNLKSCLITFSIAIFSVIISKQITSSFIVLGILSISIYLLLLLFTKQINILRLKQLIKN